MNLKNKKNRTKQKKKCLGVKTEAHMQCHTETSSQAI